MVSMHCVLHIEYVPAVCQTHPPLSFAGPSFNLLIGLGLGLLTQKEMLLSNDGLPISLMPSVQTGFVLLICNCAITVFTGVWHKGLIPKS